MKKLSIFAAFVCVFLVAACNQTGKTVDENKAPDKLIDSACYDASYETENAHMVLKNYASGKVGGTLQINYASKPANKGTIDGKFKGDTLYVDYRFTSETKNVFTNPLAFLRKDGKLIMGVGQIETTLGRSYFVKDKPINFEVGKFTFERGKCK